VTRGAGRCACSSLSIGLTRRDGRPGQSVHAPFRSGHGTGASRTHSVCCEVKHVTLARPKLVALDSATLGKVSHDYWAPERSYREKARTFLARLRDLGAFVTLTLTHIIEVLRYGDEQVVRDRLGFLRSVPLIARLRPYDPNWLPGGAPDVFLRELHAAVHGSARTRPAIVNAVRPELWEVGVGSDMFAENDARWSAVRNLAIRQQELEVHVASIARTDPGHIMGAKLSDASRLPIRPAGERDAYWSRDVAVEIQRQLDRHGDRRLGSSREAARTFAAKVRQDAKAIDASGEDPMRCLLAQFDIPPEFVSPDMTIAEIGELGGYAERLSRLAGRLRPPVDVSIRDVPPGTLPSHVLERALSSLQRKAERVSGSDLGDAHVAPLIFYAYAVQVDKRTNEFLSQVRRNEPSLASLMGRFFPSPDYSQIPKLLEE
jgi:hypothetical protein